MSTLFVFNLFRELTIHGRYKYENGSKFMKETKTYTVESNQSKYRSVWLHTEMEKHDNRQWKTGSVAKSSLVHQGNQKQQQLTVITTMMMMYRIILFTPSSLTRLFAIPASICSPKSSTGRLHQHPWTSPSPSQWTITPYPWETREKRWQGLGYRTIIRPTSFQGDRLFSCLW